MSRLWKDKLFWIGMAVTFGLGIVIPVSEYLDTKKYHFQHCFDDTFMAFLIFLGMIAAIFCSEFGGTEYSNGTIRNKLIVGHRRADIYIASLVTAAAAMLCMMAAHFLSYSIFGAILLLPARISIGKIFLLIGISVAATASTVSIFHMLTMLITKRSTAIIVCMVLFLILCIAAFTIYERLSAPETITSSVISVDGVPTMVADPNPKYLQPNERVWYQFAMDFLPTGQYFSLMQTMIVHPVQMVLYSAVICILTTALGMMFFKKKNLN